MGLSAVNLFTCHLLTFKTGLIMPAAIPYNQC